MALLVRGAAALLFLTLAVPPFGAASPLAACSTCNRGGQEPIAYSQGLQGTSSYATSSPGGVWLHFPPGRRFRFAHGLGTDRLAVHAWLAVSERPLPESASEEEVGNYAEAAGNTVVVERTDAEVVQVRNDTCAEYYLRVVVVRLE